MRVYSGDGLGDCYYQLVRDITEHGRKVEMEGKGVCIELPEPVTLVYNSPGCCWMRIPNRKWNPFLALAEIIWILTGNGNVDWISYFGSNMRSFQDGTNPDFHAAYGLRMRKWEGRQGPQTTYKFVDQFQQVIRKLKKSPNSRQAIISLWDPERDNLVDSKDYPCNNWIGYTLRDGVLEQMVVIRSNDLVWGTPYNAVQFTHVHAYVAGCLGVKMGKFSYVINNLHYYQDLYKQTLANLIEKAYSDQSLKAERAVRFDTISDNSFKSTLTAWNLLKHWNGKGLMPIELIPKIVGAQAERERFNQFDLPILLWIYCTIKERDKSITVSEAKTLAITLDAIGEPFVGLVKDFYSNSKNIGALRVIGQL